MNRIRSTYICCMIMALFCIILTVMSPLIIDIQDGFSLTLAETGFLFTSNFLGFVIFIILTCIFGGHWDKKRLLSVSLVGLTVTLISISVSPDFRLTCLSIFFIGGFSGIIESHISAVVTELNPENPGYFVNLTQVFCGVGSLVGPLLAGLILYLKMDWRICYFITAILSAILTIIFIKDKFPELQKTEPTKLSDFKQMLTNKYFLLAAFCLVLYTGSEVSSWGWMSAALKERLAFSPVKSSLAISLFWIAIIVGRYLCGELMKKIRSRILIISLAFSSAAVTIFFGYSNSETAIWLLIPMLGFACSSQWSLLVMEGKLSTNVASGTAFSVLVASGGIGISVIPLLTGFIGTAAGMRAAMLSPAVFFGLIGILHIYFGKR